jgi:alanine racemase
MPDDFSPDTRLFRPTWATVDISALRANYRAIEAGLGSKYRIMAMIKADAYGHGAVEVSRAIEAIGVRAFGVATVEEGVQLRDAGIKSPVLVMGGLMGAGSPASQKMIEMSLTPVVHSRGVLDSLDSAAGSAGKRVGVHIKVDTGMSRLGVRPESLQNLIEGIKSCENLYVEGAMTHFLDAGNAEISGGQHDMFMRCKNTIEQMLGPIPIWHVANSQAALLGRQSYVLDALECWVRPGLALFGECEGADSLLKDGLVPVMGLVSKVVLLKSVPAGTRVSYSGVFITKKRTRLAIVPIGYADGYPWRVTGKASVLIKGKRAPVAGRVTMDMIVVDVTDLDGVAVGDSVVLLGKQGDDSITLKEFASWAETIPYEILCGISKRMPRVYVE